MSHWVTLKNDCMKKTDIGMLTKALQDMGLGLDMNCKSVANSYGRSQVDMAVTKNGQVVSLGFQQNGEDLELKGDFYGSGVNEARFMDTVSQHYVKNKALSALDNEGYIFESQEVDKDGNIVIMAYQMEY